MHAILHTQGRRVFTCRQDSNSVDTIVFIGPSGTTRYRFADGAIFTLDNIGANLMEIKTTKDFIQGEGLRVADCVMYFNLYRDFCAAPLATFMTINNTPIKGWMQQLQKPENIAVPFGGSVRRSASSEDPPTRTASSYPGGSAVTASGVRWTSVPVAGSYEWRR